MQFEKLARATPAERHEMVRMAAFFRSQRLPEGRPDELDHWLEAEKDIDLLTEAIHWGMAHGSNPPEEGIPMSKVKVLAIAIDSYGDGANDVAGPVAGANSYLLKALAGRLEGDSEIQVRLNAEATAAQVGALIQGLNTLVAGDTLFLYCALASHTGADGDVQLMLRGTGGAVPYPRRNLDNMLNLLRERGVLINLQGQMRTYVASAGAGGGAGKDLTPQSAATLEQISQLLQWQAQFLPLLRGMADDLKVVRAAYDREAQLRRPLPALPSKELDVTPATVVTDQKGLADVLRVLGQVLPVVAPVLIDAVSNRGKELDVRPNAAAVDPKALSDVLRVLGQVLPAIAPVVIQALSSQGKALDTAEETAGEQKFIGALLGTLATGLLGGLFGHR